MRRIDARRRKHAEIEHYFRFFVCSFWRLVMILTGCYLKRMLFAFLISVSISTFLLNVNSSFYALNQYTVSKMRRFMCSLSNLWFGICVFGCDIDGM